MPPVRRAILSWDPRKTEEIIVFVSLWKSQLHQNIWDNVSNELILNKLEFQGNGRKVPDLRKIYMFLTFEKKSRRGTLLRIQYDPMCGSYPGSRFWAIENLLTV